MLPVRDLPLQHPVTIRWNRYAVPFIEAASDADLAFALGLVHAHLREGLLALGKRLAWGRLAEIIGPTGGKLDHTLRILGFARAAELVEPQLPEATRAWLQGFADGLNCYQDRARRRPPEYRLLGLRRERWSVRDLIAIGRVAGTDINWTTYFGLIGLRSRPDWPVIWQRALDAGGAGTASFSAGDQQAVLAGLLGGFSRSGSNCVVVAPARSASGGAMLASDPHLGVTLPNLWILAGVRSPSLRAVGLMPAGLPIFGLGRSAHMAWGGTNMRAAASDLFDLSGEPDAALATRTERLRIRFWRDRTITLRESRLGPLISDAPLFRSGPGERIALRWAGRAPSDEIGAFLAAARARTPAEFRAAFARYGVGGQNMQFADVSGNIGQIMAVWLPRRRKARPDALVLDPTDPEHAWDGLADAAGLPWVVNPPAGCLASANNPPAGCDIPVGYFFVTGERIERLNALLSRRPKLTIDDLKDLQRDVTSPASCRLKTTLMAAIEAAGLAGEAPGFLAPLRGWDGRYGEADVGPVAFEALLRQVVERLRPARRDWSTLVATLGADLAALPAADRARLLRAALRAAAKDAARFGSWGAMHRLRLQHPAARIPLLGRRFRFGEIGAGGSRETVMKTAHGLVRGRHAVTYGSQARFLADMADPDSTWAVLLGGQDGWLGSPNFTDQMPLWRGRDYIQLPMSEAAVTRDFPIVQTLTPR